MTITDPVASELAPPASSEVLVPSAAYVLSTAPDGSAEWHEARRDGLGGSDVAAALGLDRYSSPLKLYLEKTGGMPPLPPDAELEEAAEFGHALQDVIADRWAKRTGCTWHRAPGTLANREQPWMRVNVDGIVFEPDGTRGVLEIKNRSAYQRAEWEEGVPAEPAVQAYWGMAVTGLRVAHVAALVGGNKLICHRLEWDDDIVTNLVMLASNFWHNHVLAGVEPPVDGSKATEELLVLLHGVTPDKVVTADPDEVKPLLARYRELTAEKKKVEAELRAVTNRLRHLAGDGEVVVGDDGSQPLFTLKANGVFASKRFATAHPDLAEEYQTLVPTLDRQRLAEDHPELYARFRARVLRVPGEVER